MSFITAVILMAITFAFGVNDANAKTAFLVYGGKSFSPAGDYSDYAFDGMSYGIGAKFGADSSRFSFGVDFTGGQKMTKVGWEYGTVADNWNGVSVVGVAEMMEIDISGLNIPYDANYLLAYSKKTMSGTANLATFTLYYRVASNKAVELVVGGIIGASIVQDITGVEYYYHSVFNTLFPGILEQPQSGFLFPGDNGSHQSKQSKYDSKLVGVVSFGLNIFPTKHFIISPEVRYIVGFGVNARIGSGIAF
jgi:hypothetical protein